MGISAPYIAQIRVVETTRVNLSPRQERIYEFYWGWEKLTQVEIADRLYIAQPSVARHIKAIRQAYLKVGVQLPTPGATLRTVKAQTLSGVWCRNTHEYMPTQN